MPVDKFGIPFFYPTALTAGVSGTGAPFFYQQSSDILDDGNFNGEGDVTNSSGGQWTFQTEGATSVQIFKNTDSADSIGGCGMNFAQTAARGYAYRADDPRNVELKFLIKFVGSDSDNGFAIEGPTGRHSEDGCCQGFAYKVDIRYRENPPIFRFRKEMWHVSNHTDPDTGDFTHADADFLLLGHSSFVGLGYCFYVMEGGAQGTGHNTDDSVCLELWFNPDPENDITNWIMLKRTIDTGGWGNDGDQCDGDSDQIGAWSNSNFRLKSNDEGGEFIIKNLSMREIDPTLSFEDDPTTPPPTEQPTEQTTIQGFYKFQQDINHTRTSSACAGAGGGGGGGSAIFYSRLPVTDKPLSDTSTWSYRIRVGEGSTNSSGVLVGKIIKQIDVWLKKVGTPGASPTIDAKLYRAGTGPILTSSTHIDPTTLTTSFVKYTFDFSSNTIVMTVADSILIQYLGTSSTNYVVAAGDTSVLTNVFFYEITGTGRTYVTSGTLELAADIWE